MVIPSSHLHSFSRKHWIGKTDGGHRNPTEEGLCKYASELLAIIPSRGTLIDVGCGACELTTYLAPEFAKVYAIDFSETMLATARRRIIRCGITNISLCPGTAQSLSDVVQRADVVLSYGLVQYLTPVDLRQHLLECRRILSTGGKVCAANIPNSAFKGFYHRRIFVNNDGRYANRLRTWIELHRRRLTAYFKGDLLWDAIGNWFSKADIESLASDAGFTVEFRNSWFYEYRFHALLTAKAA